jgi:hypothetical protein
MWALGAVIQYTGMGAILGFAGRHKHDGACCPHGDAPAP